MDHFIHDAIKADFNKKILKIDNDYMKYLELQDILESVPRFIEGDDSYLLMELADDIYSFIAGLMFVSQNLNERKIVPLYIHSASAIRWFNQVINTADELISCYMDERNGKVNNDHLVIKRRTIHIFSDICYLNQ